MIINLKRFVKFVDKTSHFMYNTIVSFGDYFMNNKKDEDFMRDEYTKDNICNLRKNPYAKSFSPADKLKIFLDAFIKEYNWTKKETREIVDAILA